MNQRISIRLIFFVLLSFFIIITSCDRHKVLPKKTMVSVLHDIYLTESLYFVNNQYSITPETKRHLYEQVLKKHGISEAQLDSSLVWYSDNAQLFIQINDSVVSTLRSEIKLIEPLKSNDRASKKLPSNYFLSYKNPLLRFNFDSVEISKNPHFILNFTTYGVQSKDSLMFSITYVYNDTIIEKEEYLFQNKNYQFQNTPNITGKYPKSIYGFIYSEPSKIKNRSVLLNDLSVSSKSKFSSVN